MIHAKFDLFLDRSKFIRRLEKKRRRIFFRLGGFLRKTMKRLFRKAPKRASTRRKHQTRTKPPYRHAGLIRDLVFFGILGDTLFAGPTKFKGATKGKQRLLGDIESVPQLLDQGGSVIRDLETRSVRQTYKPHPFVRPTEEKGIKFYEQLIRETPL